MKHFILLILAFYLSTSSSAVTYTVTNVNPIGTGSMLAAIDNSNMNPGNDSIVFDIPGMPPHVIPLVISSTILINDSVNIDGTTQPDNGYSGFCPKIVIDASALGFITTLFHIAAPDVYISGLWFKNLTYSGSAILQINAHDVQIGAPGKKNVFSNSANSIVIADDNIVISSNIFGCNCDGTALETNSGPAIYSTAPINNLTITDNLISGNVTGILLGTTSSVSNNVSIKGNKIGTDITGSASLGNTGSGITLYNMNNLELGGSGNNEGNLISGNSGEGCLLIACSGIVFGNKIGTDISGNVTIPNDPLHIHYKSAFNCNGYSGIICSLTVGGMGAGERNIFYGNDIAFNIADSAGHYEVINNLIGQTLTGLVSPFQVLGFQLYYDTNQVRIENNYIYGTSSAIYATQSRKFFSANNVLGLDINGNALTLSNGYSLNTVDAFSIQNNVIRNCVKGMIMIDCNDSYIAMNNIQNCITPIAMRVDSTTCHSNELYRNSIAFNSSSVNLYNGLSDAANNDILPPIIDGSNMDSTWGTSRPDAAIDLCYDTTLIPLHPQGYIYSIPRIFADSAGHWVHTGFLNSPNELTAVQTDLNYNSSGFAARLTLGIENKLLDKIQIYPNPAEDYFVLENASSTEWKSWQLFNVLGVLVKEGVITNDPHQLINVQSLISGSYFLKVFSDKDSYLMKCIKM